MAAGVSQAGEPHDEPPEVLIWREEGAVEIQTSLKLPYAPTAIWEVVLDYDGLARYMPNLDSSRVITRADDVVRVRQVGGIRFIIKRTYRYELEFERVTEDKVVFRQVAGDLLGYSGEWALRPDPDGTTLFYRGTLRYGLGAPWWLGKGPLRKNVRRIMPAIREELARRADGHG
jgi:carbon monoxide dehydrogenase subunit G